jgi:hypothetical protein
VENENDDECEWEGRYVALGMFAPPAEAPLIFKLAHICFISFSFLKA